MERKPPVQSRTLLVGAVVVLVAGGPHRGDVRVIDITSHARDGSTRSVYGYRVIAYDIPPASVAGYMPELNILCGLDDYSRQSDQPLMKHQLVTVTPSQDGRTL